jgi:hypothetical protein
MPKYELITWIEQQNDQVNELWLTHGEDKKT